MDITPLTPKDKLVISHYGDGGFVVNGTPYKSNILITPHRVVTWPVAHMESVTGESLAPMFEGELPEILLIGAGKYFAPLPQYLRQYLREKNIACDAMGTGAACRTYSVLLTEGRLVAAALIAV